MPEATGHYAEGPEALVVSLAAKGDRMAFAELVRRRQSWVRNLMRRCCGDPAVAEDLSQQVFLQAWRRIRQVREPGSFGSWIRQIAIHEWLQYRRKADALRVAETGADADAAFGEEARADRASDDGTSLAMDLDRALASLPGPVRLCVVLSYHARMSHPEIATATGLALGTVKSHVRRGSSRLRELLSAYAEPADAGEVE